MENDMRQENSPGRMPSVLSRALLGALTGLPVVALSYLGSKLAGLPFFPFDLFDWLARVLPGNIITLGIDSMVSFIRLLGLGPISATAKTLEQTMGILIVIGAGTISGGVIAFAIERTNLPGRNIGAALGVLAFLFVAAIEVGLKGSLSTSALGSLLWLAVLIVGWGSLLGGWLSAQELSQVPAPVPEAYAASRRALLIKLAGGSIGLAVAAAGIGRWLEWQQQAIGANQPLPGFTPPGPANNPVSAAPTADASQMPMPKETAEATMRDRVSPAPGTRPEVTEAKDFYRTDIDTIPPVVDKASWKLQVKGLFDHPRDLTFNDVLAYPAVTQPVTMSCISNPVGGDLISTNNWTGVRLRDVLRDLGLRPQARSLEITSADG
ncbi:MAG TPA: molybdopterin-dependent oxidoreductase, partial [Anaerolineae bacterium]